MFKIPDDDLLWNDDFPIEELQDHVEGSKAEVESTTKTFELPNVNNADYQNSNNQHTGHSREQTRVCTRKFPGPAGVLPPYSPGAALDTKLHETSDVLLPLLGSPDLRNLSDVKDEVHSLSWSQTPTDDISTWPQWKAMVSDLGQDAELVLSKFSIKSALLKASRKLLNRGKIPLLIGVIDSFEMHGPNASFVIRDPSGKMNGALHRDLFIDPSTALQAGSVLVLRQMSVISPSSRTHYLNITPGNIVLVYRANREAEVSRGTWSPSEAASGNPQLVTDGSEVQFLHQVIEDSKKELSNPLRSFHQGTCEPPSSTLSSTSSFRTNRLTSGHTINLMQRGIVSVPKYNTTAGGPSVSLPSRPLFTSSHQTITNSAQGNYALCGTTTSPGNLTGSHIGSASKYQNSKASSCHYSLNGNKAKCALTPTGDRITPPLVQNEKKNLYHSGMFCSDSPSHKPKNSELCKSLINNSSLNKDKSRGEEKQTIDDFGDEFLDNDDQIMLQAFDEVLNETPTEKQGNTTLPDNQREFIAIPREFIAIPTRMEKEQKTHSVISKVFEDCRRENQILNDYSESAAASNKCIPTGNAIAPLKLSSFSPVVDYSQNSSFSSPAPNSVNKFSFRRSHPLTHSSPLPAKRPMLEAANHSTVNSSRSPFNDRRNTLNFNKSLCANKERCDNYQSNNKNYNSPAFNMSVACESPAAFITKQSINLNYPITSAKHVACNDQSSFQRVSSDISRVSMFSEENLHSRNVIQNNEAPVVDSEDKSFKGFDSSAAVSKMTSLFPAWNDDLNDDLLLSQLSDEF